MSNDGIDSFEGDRDGDESSSSTVWFSNSSPGADKSRSIVGLEPKDDES